MAHLGSYVAALQYYMLENDWCNQKMFYTNDLLVMKTICHLNNLTLVLGDDTIFRKDVKDHVNSNVSPDKVN